MERNRDLKATLALSILILGSMAVQAQGIYVSPLFPPELRSTIVRAIGTGIPEAVIVDEPVGADLLIGASRTDEGVYLGTRCYALVAPFSEKTDGVSVEEWSAFISENGMARPFPASDVLADEETAPLAGFFVGERRGRSLRVVPHAELLDACWSSPRSWAIIAFEDLAPPWKVLHISGMDVLSAKHGLEGYPLILKIGASGDPALASRLKAALGNSLDNRDAGALTSVTMTGVTAMARVTASRMDKRGVKYPGLKIAGILSAADFTHVSNEVSFSPGCVIKTTSDTLLLCSRPEYAELLDFIGADLIELTGNHLLDFGQENFLNTLKLYGQRGMRYFGGGRNAEEAAKTLVIEHNGNRLAFIGACVGPSPSYAGKDRAGPLLFDEASIIERIKKAKSEGQIPIVCVQYYEEYRYDPSPPQRRLFKALIDAGAAIVQGSQAHQPQAFEFHGGGFIHYGLGNLFFDQMWSLGTRESLIDTHYFYRGRHVSTMVRTALIEDYGQPRPTEGAERNALLEKVFAHGLRNGSPFPPAPRP